MFMCPLVAVAKRLRDSRLPSLMSFAEYLTSQLKVASFRGPNSSALGKATLSEAHSS